MKEYYGGIGDEVKMPMDLMLTKLKFLAPVSGSRLRRWMVGRVAGVRDLGITISAFVERYGDGNTTMRSPRIWRRCFYVARDADHVLRRRNRDGEQRSEAA